MTKYSVPAGVTSVSADGVEFLVDEDGHIDVTDQPSNVISALVMFARCEPVLKTHPPIPPAPPGSLSGLAAHGTGRQAVGAGPVTPAALELTTLTTGVPALPAAMLAQIGENIIPAPPVVPTTEQMCQAILDANPPAAPVEPPAPPAPPPPPAAPDVDRPIRLGKGGLKPPRRTAKV